MLGIAKGPMQKVLGGGVHEDPWLMRLATPLAQQLSLSHIRAYLQSIKFFQDVLKVKVSNLGVDGIGGAATLMVAESAQLKAVAPTGHPLHGVLREKLSERCELLRLVFLGYIAIWVVSWLLSVPQPFATSPLHPVTVLCGVLLIATLLAAASFPFDIVSPPGRRFAFPGMLCCSITACVGGCINFFHRSTSMHVNPTCKAVHALLCIFIALAWITATILAWRAHLNWQRVRILYIFDGLCHLCATVLLYWLGPPPIYPPSDAPLGMSLLRGAVCLAMGLCLTPTLRQCIASVAISLGLHHIRVDLCELSQGKLANRQPCVDDLLSDRLSDSMASHVSNGSPSLAASHHSVRCSGPCIPVSPECRSDR